MNKNILPLLGIWVAIDGFVSLLYYQGTQTSGEIAVRVLRILVGLMIYRLTKR